MAKFLYVFEEHGQVTMAEAQQGGMTDYSAADRNGDGGLDQSEFLLRTWFSKSPPLDNAVKPLG